MRVASNPKVDPTIDKREASGHALFGSARPNKMLSTADYATNFHVIIFWIVTLEGEV